MTRNGPEQAQVALEQIYTEWKAKLVAACLNGTTELTSPFWLCPQKEYYAASQRVMMFGQETRGWQWDGALTQQHHEFPPWPFAKLECLADFLREPEGVSGLCWGYREFKYGDRMPVVARSPLWRFFRKIETRYEPGAVVMNNLAKVAMWCEGQEKHSFLEVPEPTRSQFLHIQQSVAAREMELLRPDVCLFVSGLSSRC